jgi:hypothetical protein
MEECNIFQVVQPQRSLSREEEWTAQTRRMILVLVKSEATSLVDHGPSVMLPTLSAAHWEDRNSVWQTSDGQASVFWIDCHLRPVARIGCSTSWIVRSYEYMLSTCVGSPKFLVVLEHAQISPTPKDNGQVLGCIWLRPEATQCLRLPKKRHREAES